MTKRSHQSKNQRKITTEGRANTLTPLPPAARTRDLWKDSTPPGSKNRSDDFPAVIRQSLYEKPAVIINQFPFFLSCFSIGFWNHFLILQDWQGMFFTMLQPLACSPRTTKQPSGSSTTARPCAKHRTLCRKSPVPQSSHSGVAKGRRLDQCCCKASKGTGTASWCSSRRLSSSS